MGRSWIVGAVILALGLVTVPGRAQDNPNAPQRPKPEAAKAEGEAQGVQRRASLDLLCTPDAGLRVQLVITRLQNDKKLASLPYTFVVPARRSSSCPERIVLRMRMGVDTPVPVTSYTASESNSGRFPTSFQYKNVGTNIDCSATDLGDGRYQLSLHVENSSALAGPPSGATSGELSGVPLFRSFSVSVDPILRDGQTVQTVASTDPVTGEVVKIDVSLSVVK
jgi:hypothetical protein